MSFIASVPLSVAFFAINTPNPILKRLRNPIEENA
jgi:hypothetical protein